MAASARSALRPVAAALGATALTAAQSSPALPRGSLLERQPGQPATARARDQDTRVAGWRWTAGPLNPRHAPLGCSPWSPFGGSGDRERTPSAPSGQRSGRIGPPGDFAVVLDAVRPHVASVYAVDSSQRRGLVADPAELKDADVSFLGSGFAYGDGQFVATCAHLFENKDLTVPVVIRFGDGRWRSAVLHARCSLVDVAVLRLENDGTGDMPVGTRSGGCAALVLDQNTALPRQGDWIGVCGATQHGLQPVGLAGLVSQPRQAFRGGLAEEPGVHFMQLALPTLPGMSGSPVLDRDGNVVGMMAKKFEEHGLAFPASRVAAVVRSLERIGGEVAWRPPVLGMDLQPGGSLAEPCVIVRSVRKGGPAEQGGVQPGDGILLIAGQPVHSVLDVREALYNLGDSRDANAKVVRLALVRPGELTEGGRSAGKRGTRVEATLRCPAQEAA